MWKAWVRIDQLQRTNKQAYCSLWHSTSSIFCLISSTCPTMGKTLIHIDRNQVMSWFVGGFLWVTRKYHETKFEDNHTELFNGTCNNPRILNYNKNLDKGHVLIFSPYFISPIPWTWFISTDAVTRVRWEK